MNESMTKAEELLPEGSTAELQRDSLRMAISVKMERALLEDANYLLSNVDGELKAVIEALRHRRALVEPAGGEADAYAVRMQDGAWVGLWNTKEIAESVRAKQPKGHHDTVVPLFIRPAEDLRDAERYRWLRNGNTLMVCNVHKLPKEWYAGTALDAAIDDAARRGG